MNNEPEKKQYRGTIIVDAVGLIDLSAQIPQKFCSDEFTPKTYLETLKFLAANNYHVIIPEMVSLEASDVLADGRSIGKHFAVKEQFKEMGKVVNPFLREVAVGAIPNIEIVPNTGPQEVDEHCKGISKALDNLKDMKNDFRAMAHKTKTKFDSTKTDITARVALIRGLEKTTDTTNFGDKSILSLLKNNYASEKNVFVLTRDSGLRNSIREQYSNANAISTPRLMYGLIQAGLGKYAGIAENVSALDFENSRRDAITKNRGNPLILLTPENDDNYSKSSKDSPFNNSLKELSLELKEKEAMSKTEIKSDGKSNVDKFRARYQRSNPRINNSGNGNDSHGL